MTSPTDTLVCDANILIDYFDINKQTFPIFAKRVSFPACSVKKLDPPAPADEPEKK